jgi:Kef-type K+ transport system membrane component KefB/mannitol/fructose-specific phosphotransferase system IIA component (Ntr-type)
MAKLTAHEITTLCLSLGVLLVAARCLGELARRFGQPAVLGEILTGILLGPTLLGHLAPELSAQLLPTTGGAALGRDAIVQVALVLFLLIAGLEVDLSLLLKQGRAAAAISVCGMVVPFLAGFAAAWYLPRAFGAQPGADRAIFALFFATALAITALPVIAKTLLDLNLYRTDIGMIVIAAAVFDDLIGWLIFAVILGMISAPDAGSFGLPTTIVLTLSFAALMFTAGRWAFHRVLPWVQAHTSFPGGVLALALSAALLAASFTEWIGIHAIFGSFLVGVALGDSAHLRARTRATLEQFVSFFFAPLFFASIGLRVDFLQNFDPLLCALVLAIACAGKLAGCLLGARWAGMELREGWAVAFGMNARGAMEIVLGLLAFQAGLIDERMFVALVVMALATSLMSGPLMRRVLARKNARQFQQFLPSKAFVARLRARERREAIGELCLALAETGAIDARSASSAVWQRELATPTGIGNAIAVPHARIAGLQAPLIALGLSADGIDFDAPDGHGARIVMVILSPPDDHGAQLEILADMARLFARPEVRTRALEVRSHTEFLALVQAERSHALH